MMVGVVKVAKSSKSPMFDFGEVIDKGESKWKIN